MHSTLLKTIRPAAIRSSAGDWVTRTGLAGTLTALLTASFSPALFALGVLMALLAAGVDFRRTYGWLAEHRWPALLVVLTAWVLMHGLADAATGPAAVDEPGEAIWAHVRFTGIPALILGMWIARHWRGRWGFVGVPIAGLILGFLVNGEWHRLDDYLGGVRADFVASNPQVTAFITAPVLVLALGVLAFGLCSALDGRRRAIAAAVLSGAIALALGVLLVLTQSRSAFLALLACVPVCLAGWGRCLWRHPHPASRRLVAGGAAAIALAGLVAGTAFFDIALARFTETLHAVRSLGDGDPTGSIELRYALLRQGLGQVLEAPWLGVGPVTVLNIIPAEGIAAFWRGGFWLRDYHNAYLNLAVAMGVPWALLWLCAHAWAGWRAARGVIEVDREPILGWTLTGTAGVIFVFSLFKSQLFSLPEAAVHVSVFALVFGAALAPRVQELAEGSAA